MGYGGYYTDRKNDFWEYDPVMNVWVQKADFGGPSRVYSTSFSIGSKGYVGVGNPNDGGAIKKDFWEYDPAINKWTQKADFAGTARYSATGLSIGNKGYIGLGENTINFSKRFLGVQSWLR
jgi:N-acetylneuraminic acid mutarotase